MKTKILSLILPFVLLPTIAFAISSRGEINKALAYDHLKIKRDTHGNCGISGELVNRSREMVDDVRVKVYAYTIHDSFLWAVVIPVETLPPGQMVRFFQKIKACRNAEPYTLSFQVLKPVPQE